VKKQPLPVLAVNVEGAAQMLSISVRSVRELIKNGQLTPPFGSIIEDQKKKDAESIERDVRSVLKRLIDHLDRKDQDDEDDL
jgi:hypothetical protein